MWKGQRVDEDGGGGREAEFWGDEGCSGYDINPLRGTPLVILRISRVHAQSQVRYDVIKYNPTF